MFLKHKASQEQVIVTVLLILLGIAAVAIVSMVVINFVKDQLKFTDCFSTAGELNIDLDAGYTYFNKTVPSDKRVFVSVTRGTSDEFNLTGLLIIVSNGAESFSVKLSEGLVGNDTHRMYNNVVGGVISLPGIGERKTYNLKVADLFPDPTTVELYPIIDEGEQCGLADKKELAL